MHYDIVILDSIIGYLNVVFRFVSLLQFLKLLQREKRNLQDLNDVFVFNVGEREYLDRPTAKFIKDFEGIEGKGFSLSLSPNNLRLYF